MKRLDVPGWLANEYWRKGQRFAWTSEMRKQLGVSIAIKDPLNPEGLMLEFESEEDLIEVLRQWPDSRVSLAYRLTWAFLSSIANDIVPAVGRFEGIERQPSQWGLITIEAYAEEINQSAGKRTMLY